MAEPLSYWYLDPYAVDSHAQVRGTYVAHSRFPWRTVPLAGRSWRWRLRNAGAALALELQGRIAPGDVVLSTSMLDLAQFKGVLGTPVRTILYMHENQLTYARAAKGRVELALRHIHSLLAADAVAFNSAFHRDAFATALKAEVRGWPPAGAEAVARLDPSRWAVVHPGVAEAAAAAGGRVALPAKPAPPLVLWNHRWCAEKDPEAFFAAVDALAARGIDFRLAVVGSENERPPAIFAVAAERHAGRIAAWGFQPRARYEDLLDEAAIVVSTAREENFGLAVVEAMARGAVPVLPRRLSYPELLPAELHGGALYEDPAAAGAAQAGRRSGGGEGGRMADDLVERLAGWLTADAADRAAFGARVADAMANRFPVAGFAAKMDAMVAEIAVGDCLAPRAPV